MAEQTADPPPTKPEQRRSRRFPVVVPVEVKWQEPSGKICKEAVQAREVNAHGGLLDMKVYPWVSGDLELTNLLSGDSAKAHVVGAGRSKDGVFVGVAVALMFPNETFWGVNFQLRKTSADLANIEQAIESGGVDPRILREFREAMDYVRKAAWVVQEWQEHQLQKHDPQTVLPLLTAERIRRATQLNKAIATDLAAHELTSETAGLEELFQAVESLYQRVADLLGRMSQRNNNGPGEPHGQARAEEVQNANKKGDKDRKASKRNNGKKTRTREGWEKNTKHDGSKK